MAFKAIEDLTDKLDNRGLASLYSNYTTSSAADVVLNIRGLSARASYDQGATALNFVVPSVGIDLTFQGATRDQSQDQFVEFLKGNGSGILSRLLKALVAQSPVDPVAGNPASLQSQMADRTFGSATGFGVLDEPFGKTDAGGTRMVPGLLTAGGDVGVARSGGYNMLVTTLPIKYSYYFDDPRYAVIFDLPLTYLRTENAQSAQGSFGVGVRVPVIDNWFLVPSARVGATGSLDLGAAALMYSGDLTSVYNIYADDLKITIGNGVGFYQTQRLRIGDFDVDYKLRNTVTKNGISIEGPLGEVLFDQPTSWQLYLTDTHLFGDKLYVQHYDEVGLIMGTRPRMDGQSWDSFRFGVSYTVGSNYNAVKANFGYRF